MIVTLDGQCLEADFTSADTLQALIDRVRAEHLPDRLVVSIAVNGQLLLPEDLDARLSQPPAPQDQVDLESGDPRAIVADALRQAAEQLAAAGQAQQEVADQLNAGQVAEALERVGELVGVWQAGQQVVVRCCALLGEDLTAVEYGGRPIREHLGELAEKLRELRDAFEARDMVLLADLLHYEMPPLCETWHGLFTHLADTIAGHAVGSRAEIELP
jgi:hypothetical protein